VSPDWLVTLPVPAPWPLVILTMKGPFRNTAETVRLAVILKVQVPSPVQTGTLSQPPNAVPAAGVAVSVTACP
jgi:hypothetical protein